MPYKCRSWRCHHCTAHQTREGCLEDPSGCRTCARREASVTFARIVQAAGPLETMGWCFGVLTLDRQGYYSRETPWRDATAAFRELGRMWRTTLKRWRRWMEADGMRPIGHEWIMVVEAHQSGWPHANVMIWSPDLAAYLRKHAPKRSGGHAPACRCAECHHAALLFGPLLKHGMECKWGRRSTLEPARSAEALAGYVTKLAAHGEATGGELAKITQAPMQAPERFRRLRSGKGFLPKRRRNPEVTGTLVRRITVADMVTEFVSEQRVAEMQGKPRLAEVIARERVQLEGEDQARIIVVRPLFEVSPERAADVQAACQLEADYARAELERERRNDVARATDPRGIEYAPWVVKVRDPYRKGLEGMEETKDVDL